MNLSTELVSQYAFLQQGPEASMLWLTAYQWAALFCLLENDGVTFFFANDFDKAIRHRLCVVLGGICCEFMQEHWEIREGRAADWEVATFYQASVPTPQSIAAAGL